jgi:predicted negative regulator of RcsB-dependent stress response
VADSDEEQIEELKAWWAENGNSLVITIVLALAVVFGYRAWQNSEAEAAEAASTLYESISVAVRDAPATAPSAEVLTSLRSLGNQLKTDYPDSTYAHFGALHMAKIAADRKEYETAEIELMWMLDNDVDGILEPVARMRLALVLVEQDRADEALQMLSVDIELGAHAVSWHETQGDIYYKMGDNENARDAYQTAVDLLSEDDSPRPMLMAKLQDLPVTPSAEEATQVAE